MVEDMARNLVPAAALGMTTVWVPTAAEWSKPDRPADIAHIHHTAPDLAAFLTALTAAACPFSGPLRALSRGRWPVDLGAVAVIRSEEHTCELQLIMRLSTALICLKN